MSADNKVNAEPEQQSESDSSDCSDDEDVTTHICGFPPNPNDKEGMVKLLEQQFRGSTIDLVQVADMLIYHNFIGNVSRVVESSDEEDEEPVSMENSVAASLTSFVNLKQNEGFEVVREIIRFLVQRALEFGGESKCQQLKEILNLENTGTSALGMLFKERFCNLTPLVAVKELEGIKRDVPKAIQAGKMGQTTHVVQIMKMYKKQGGEMAYVHEEDEVGEKYAVLSFDYPLDFETYGPIMYSEDDVEDQLEGRPFRRVNIYLTPQFFNEYISDYKNNLPANSGFAIAADMN